MSRSNGYIYAVNGPVIKVKGDRDLSMQEMVCLLYTSDAADE